MRWPRRWPTRKIASHSASRSAPTRRYSAAEHFDAGEDAGAHANMAKLLGSQAAVAAVEAAMQTHGGYGFDRDYDIVTLWPMVRLLEIAPINNEMLLNYIGEHVLVLPKSY